MFLESAEGFTVITKVGNYSATALNNLSRLAFFIDLTETDPLTKFCARRDLHQTNAMFNTQTLDEFFVFRLVAIVGEATELDLLGVKRLAHFVKSTLESVVSKCILQHLLQSNFDVKNRGGCFCGHFCSWSFFLSHDIQGSTLHSWIQRELLDSSPRLKPITILCVEYY